MKRLTTFGALALGGAEGSAAGRGRNLGVLTMLAVAGAGGIDRERIAGFLWPESPPERARHSLDQALYVLRRALGADAITASGTSLAMDPDVVSSDVGEFTEALGRGDLESAVRLYAGPFAEGFAITGLVEFERWLEGERDRLHRAYAAVLESLARGAAGQGAPDAAVRWWRRLAAAEPLSARAAVQLMRALVDAGDCAGALCAARVHETLVRTELGTETDAAVVELCARIRALPPPVAPEAAADERPARPVVADADPPAPPVAARTWRARRRWLAAAALVALATSGGLYYRGDLAGEELPRVTVQPLVNHTGDPRFDVLGRMAADWVAQALARTGQLQVMDAEGSRPAGARGWIAGAGAGSSTVAGTIYGEGDSIRLSVRLVDDRTGRVLATLEPIRAPAREPAAALGPLGNRVLAAVALRSDRLMRPFADAAARPPTYEAYQEFVAGQEAIASFTPDSLREAARRFGNAIRLDSQYTQPVLWLVKARMHLQEYAAADSLLDELERRRPTLTPLERAYFGRLRGWLDGNHEASYRAAQEMARLEPSSGWRISLILTAGQTNRPRTALRVYRQMVPKDWGTAAWLYYLEQTPAHHALGDYRAELRAAGQARAHLPDRRAAYVGAVNALAAMGRVAELERVIRDAEALPADRGPRILLGKILYYAGTELNAHGHRGDPFLERAIAWYHAEARGGTLSDEDRFDLALALRGAGRPREALAEARRLAQANPGEIRYLGLVGTTAAAACDRAEAERVAALLAAPGRAHAFGEHTFWRARIAAVLGQGERAVALLRQAHAEGQGFALWDALHVEKDLQGLRGLRSFQDFARPRDE